MKVAQTCIGRFHHFHLARELEKRGWLEALFTGYPHFKLKDETGVPASKIQSFPWIHAPFMVRGRLGLTGKKISADWAWLGAQTLDRYVSHRLKSADVLIALSGSGLQSGRVLQQRGGLYFCDRASTHIRFQDRILREESAFWGVEFCGVDPRFIAKEEAEYELADCITVPSEFVYQSFLNEGVEPAKLRKIPFGARLDRFRRTGEPLADGFEILFVGQVSLRKGFLYLLEAFQRFRHPGKRLTVIGAVLPEMESLLAGQNLDGVDFRGQVPNAELAACYNRARVFVLPSIEEGFGYVLGEALACGCPVIATFNSGAIDLFSDGQEGFIIPVRNSAAILEKLEYLAQDPAMADAMRERALKRVKTIGGWSDYGSRMADLLTELRPGRRPPP